MSFPFLIIQLRPEDLTADSEFEAIKRYAGLEDSQVERIRAEREGLPELNLDSYSGIIVGGSPFDISLPKEKKTAIQRKIESDFSRLFEEILAKDFPFLGCCSGSGLLGTHCGAKVSGRFGEPVSAVDVNLTEEGRKDPLLQGLPERFRVLLGHKEACEDLPPDCRLLLRGDFCKVQMFRRKKNVYATQFHPEGDYEGFVLRIQVYKDHGYFPAEAAEQLIAQLRDERTPEANLILQRFANRYRRH